MYCETYRRERYEKISNAHARGWGAVGVGLLGWGVSFQLAGERDLYSERRLDFLSGYLFSLLGDVGFFRVGYKEKKVSI